MIFYFGFLHYFDLFVFVLLSGNFDGLSNENLFLCIPIGSELLDNRTLQVLAIFIRNHYVDLETDLKADFTLLIFTSETLAVTISAPIDSADK